MSNNAQNLTRKQLAEFLPDPRAVRMFENLLKQVNTLIPADTGSLFALVQEAYIDAMSADAKATQALDALERIALALELIANGPASTLAAAIDEPLPPTIPVLAEDNLLPPVLPQQAEDNLAPPVPLGTLGTQQAEDVNITGGSVAANLTNNQTVLMKTSATLTNGAAAATGTLTNAPAAGNPTKWVPINDNGTTRYIPAW